MLYVAAVLAVAAGIYAGACWRAVRQMTVRLRVSQTLECRYRDVLDATAAMMAASRTSAHSVLQSLDGAIRACDPSVDACVVFVPVHEDLVCAYAAGARTEHYRALRLARHGASLPARAAAAGHRAVLRLPGDALIASDRSAVAVPLADASGLHAVTYVSSTQPGGLRAEETIVLAVAHAVAPYALAVEREADRAHATFDGLTGLLTPRAFRDLLFENVERLRFREGGGVLSLWFVDTDRFKSVNDIFGHAAGDAVLQGMAALLRAHMVEGIDIAARNGGDEFCALVFDAQKTSAIRRAHAFCTAVRTHPFSVRASITASVGVATLPYDAANASELLEVADAAMYHSKRNGRDRVSFAVGRGAFEVFATETP